MIRPRVHVYGSFRPPGTPCGVTSAVQNLVASPLGEWFDLEVISTFRDPDPNRGLGRRLAHGVRLGSTSMWRTMARHADIVDVHAVSGRDFLTNAAPMIAARSVGRPVLLRIHGGNFADLYDDARPWERRLVSALLRLPDRVVVLSRYWQRVLTGIQPRANVTVIPNSVDGASLGETARERSPDADAVLLLGNLCERKGHFDALEAAAIVKRSFPGCRFLFAGAERDEGALGQLRARTRELGIEANVEFLGPVFDVAKRNVIVRAGIFALPSHVENMPVSLVEAMAAGLPAVASRVGAIPEMIVEGETGFMIDAHDVEALADRLCVLLADGERRRAMGAAGQRRAVERWDRAVIAEATASVYRELLAQR